MTFEQTLKEWQFPSLGRVYFDMKSKDVISFKHKTEMKRQEQRLEEWSTLQQYCLHGKVPADMSLWEREFPKNRLFITQIMHTFLQNEAITMKFCEEEADAVVARAVRGCPNKYIVGMDSDFCFFPNVNYIPITTIFGSKNKKAIVIRRNTLAESLALPSEASLVDLAILMGNDYMDGTELDLPEEIAKIVRQDKPSLARTNAIIDFVATDPVLSTRNPQASDCLTFVRKLYNLEDMSEYPMEATVSVEDNAFIPAIDESIIDLKTVSAMDNEIVADAVLRYLKLIVENPTDGTDPFLTQAHVDAFQVHATMPSRPVDQDMVWRPDWTDIPAAYWIERITSKVIRNTMMNRMGSTQFTDPPSVVFDPYHYHSMFFAARAKHCASTVENPTSEVEAAQVNKEEPNASLESEDNQRSTAAEPKAESPPSNLKLPVDEYEEQILESVRNNRVTIIQGETGCGECLNVHCTLAQ